MTLPELLTTLDEQGVNLSLRLRIDAPSGALTPKARAYLYVHKAALMVHLAREAQWQALRDQRGETAKDDPTPGIDVHPPQTPRPA
jgi:hypothetical protein